METTKKIFSRFLLVILIIFIGLIVFFNSSIYNHSSNISSGIIILISFLIILVLSESFDNFSVGQLFSLSRRIKEKEAANKELKRENVDLRAQLITVATSVNQKQLTANYFLTEDLARRLSVRQADIPEIEQDKKQKEAEQDTDDNTATTTTTTTLPPVSPLSSSKSKMISKEDEDEILRRFVKDQGLASFPLVRDVKFSNEFKQIDPISENSPVFDGYLKSNDTEIFIEIKLRSNFILYRYRLYHMLSKINHYRNVKKLTAYLYLVIYMNEPNKSHFLSKLKSEFEPAINSGLLIVHDIQPQE